MKPKGALTAIDGYDGVFFQVIRKYAHKAKLEPHDVAIIFGLLVGDQKLRRILRIVCA